MKLHLTQSELNLITYYDDNSVEIQQKIYTGNLIITPLQVNIWSVSGFADLRAEDFAGLLNFAPELIILGTGAKQLFPPPHLYVNLMQAGVGLEIMDKLAACRTYNILLAEGRSVLAALLT